MPLYQKKLMIPGLFVLALVVLATCSQSTLIDDKYITAQDRSQGGLSSQTIALNASSPALDFTTGTVITDNDMAFRERLDIVQQAQNTLDLGYYIYRDDYSSSVFSKALIDAAHRGVTVRLLLDYRSGYPNLDLFAMLEKYGNQGKGSLEVRFYNRPTANIIRDAVYLTLGCGEVGKEDDLKACSQQKYLDIESRLVNDKDPLNYNSGASGAFLSAFYSGDIERIALAIMEGQSIENPFSSNSVNAQHTESPTQGVNSDDIEKLIALGKIFIKARHSSGFEKLMASLKLKLAFAFFGGEINPYYDAFTAYLPVGRNAPRHDSLRDWNYVTDFFHQKLILADSKTLMLGGRNIEDVYHLQESPLIHEHQFMDTDVKLELRQAETSLSSAFERLWQFREMVATLDDVRKHAPNDLIVASQKADVNCQQLAANSLKQQQCQENTLRQFASPGYRIQLAYHNMQQKVAEYHQRYQPESDSSWPHFAIDQSAEVYYLENLPFKKSIAKQRLFGAENGQEGRSGKYIHNLWLAALRNSCQNASAENPQDVIIHSAYVFMPSNLLRQLSDMLSGKQACQHVHIKVLTNSIETTDLGIENQTSRYALKALVEHINASKNPAQAASLSYLQYRPLSLGHDLKPSLHSKVMVFGDDIYIGSANADVRSYMMDANNGLYIRKAPTLIQNYKAWLDTLIADPQRVTDITTRLEADPLEQMLDQDSTHLITVAMGLMGKPGEEKSAAGKPLDADLQEQLRLQLKAVLKKVYSLTRKGLSDDADSTEAQRNFNNLFKLI